MAVRDPRPVMHDDELDITDELGTRLIATQFPQWQTLPIRRVASDGTVHAIFRVGHDLSARFPLRAEDDTASARCRLEREQAAAAEFAANCPFPAPTPVAVGEPA